MSKYSVFICLVVLNLCVYGSTGGIKWASIVDGPSQQSDCTTDIITEPKGNIIVTGYMVNNGNYDFGTIKYSPSGNVIWTKYFNYISTKNDYAMACCADSNSNITVCGYTQISTLNINAMIVKYDPNGNQLWAKSYTSSGDKDDRFYDVLADSHGNFYAAGRANGDCLLIKYSPQGNLLWAKTFNGSGNGFDSLYKIAIDPNGNIYGCGESAGAGSSADCLLIKYSANGALLWSRTYDGGAHRSDWLEDLAIDSKGNVFVTGTVDSGTDSNFITIKYNKSGTRMWASSYGSKFNMDESISIALCPNGDVAVAGFIEDDYFTKAAVVKYNSTTGSIIWNKICEGPAYCNSYAQDLCVDKDGNVYVYGTIDDCDSSNFQLLCYKPNGDSLYEMNFVKYTNPNTAAAMVMNGTGIYLTGYTISVGNNYDYLTMKLAASDGSKTLCLAPIRGDLNDDCKVNFQDIIIMAQNWMTWVNHGSGNACEENLPADLDGNCKINIMDFVILANNWMVCNLSDQSECWPPKE